METEKIDFAKSCAKGFDTKGCTCSIALFFEMFHNDWVTSKSDSR